MIHRIHQLLLLWLSLFCLPVSAGGIMSVNQCVDQMLGYLAPEQLASVTWLSHAPSSLEIAPTLLQLPANHAQIEDVLKLQPQTVIAGQYGAGGLKALLERIDQPWREIALPTDLKSLYSNWTQLGQWVEQPQLAKQISHEIDAGMRAVREQLAPLEVRTVLINANGWVAGQDNFQDAWLQAIGLRNLAAETGIQGWGQLSLEQLVRWQPDFILVPQSHYAAAARATQWQSHPVIARLSGRYPLLQVDADWLSCGTPALVRAAELIRDHLLGPDHRDNTTAGTTQAEQSGGGDV